MGITAEALQLALVAALAAGTGYVVANSYDSLSGTDWGRLWDGTDVGDMTDDDNYADGYLDGSLGVAGQRKWDDLSTDEKAKYGTPAAYNQAQWAALDLEYGLIEATTGGGYEPSEDPGGDGSEKFWNKRNVLALLATGGAVALGEVAGAVADMGGKALHDWLFGSQATDMNLRYISILDIDGKIVPFATFDGVRTSNRVVTSTSWLWGNRVNQNTELSATQYFNPANTNVNAFVNANNQWVMQPGGGQGINVFDNGNVGNANDSGNVIIAGTVFVNANYAGSITFGNHKITAGVWDNPPTTNSVNYGQMPTTPVEIPQTITNPQTWIQTINNYQNSTDNEDSIRAVTVPTVVPGAGSEYQDYVSPQLKTNVEQLPETGPVKPKPPDVPDQWETDFGERVGQLLAQPFDNLFPFCLIHDLDVLQQKVVGEYSASGSTTVVIPLNAFNVQGMDALTIDGTMIAEVGGYVRPWVTVLFIVTLLVGSFAFFLKRGGD